MAEQVERTGKSVAAATGATTPQLLDALLQQADAALWEGDLDAARATVMAAMQREDLWDDEAAFFRTVELAMMSGMADEALELCTEALRREVWLARSETVWRQLRQLLDDDEPSAAPVQRRPADGGSGLDGPAPVFEGDVVTPLLTASLADKGRFLHLFAGREDVHARQWADGASRGGYGPVRAPLTPEVLSAHLSGSMTLGVYVLRLDDAAGFFCLDFDITRKALQAADERPDELHRLQQLVHRTTLDVQRTLAELGLELLLEESGHKGRHLWGFLREPVAGVLLHRFGRSLASWIGPLDARLSLEFFPKQAEKGSQGLGNLVKLPLGVHRVSGRRSVFMVGDEVVTNPWPLLHAVPRLSRAELMDLHAQLRRTPTRGAHDTQSVSVNADSAIDDRGGEAAGSSPGVAGKGAGRSPAQAGSRAPGAEPAQAPSVTMAQLLQRARFQELLAGCCVLADIVERAQQARRLSHHERVVLVHSLGHVVGGVEAVNAVLALCPDTPPQDRLKRMLRGHPISCGRIRERIPEVTSRLPCMCEFEVSDVWYPHPARHLDGWAYGLLDGPPLTEVAAGSGLADALPAGPSSRGEGGVVNGGADDTVLGMGVVEWERVLPSDDPSTSDDVPRAAGTPPPEES